ncbi:MAG: mannose-6-phosphate isomerase-like protein (cupin superfamily) [Pseudohongiellaceae bacterium]|jgi:mannose-6-phosphate isomerase-like protein (cupin superfamily)
MKKLILALITLPAIILLSYFSSIYAQTTGAPAALYMTEAQILETLERAAAESASAGGWSVAVAPGISVRRRSSGVKQYAIIHPYSMEIYRVLEGSGTFVTGGRLILPLAESPTEDIVRTLNGVEGGLERQVKAGDVLVLQPGTPHWFKSIDGDTISYMESRVRISTHPIQFQN